MEDAIGLTDLGESLDFRLPFKGGFIPVRISRQAMQDHFGAKETGGGMALSTAYLANPGKVHERVAPRVNEGASYSSDYPLLISTRDI